MYHKRNFGTDQRSYSAMGAWASSRVEDDVVVREAVAGSVELTELRFPPGYVQGRFKPPRGYLAVVLEGGMTKCFGCGPFPLAAGELATMPALAAHETLFGDQGCRVLVVKPPATVASPLLRHFRVRTAPGVGRLAERVATELASGDTAAPVAAEGLALQLVAAALRSEPTLMARARPPWFATVLELLRDPPSWKVADLAKAVAIDPDHLGRVFRRHYGVSISTYLRELRLDRAAASLVLSDVPVAQIAADEGFADQSHFTQAFRRHVGVTPARYRRLARAQNGSLSPPVMRET
jgi:AraC family transcriptional regulator